MTEPVLTLGTLIGGLGLFLLAMKMMTDGLRFAAGEALRDLLVRSTRTPGRGIAAGCLITMLVQSSSAVTVATLGFVNAGLLSLYQGLGLVYGANVGTTMTGWLVALVGFKIKVELFAFPLIGFGMLLRLTGPAQRRGALGEALAGFGLFFIGIDALQTAFEGIAATHDLSGLSADDLVGMSLLLWAGFLMTLLTQSSSAAIALILSAVTGGVLSLQAGAVLVIGANVGTTSTAALAAVGATPNAKRVAAAHILFNVATAGVALLLLPILMWSVDATKAVLGLDDVPAVTLALFHTVFNVLGVLLLWPLTARMTEMLERRFRTQEETEARPRFLDRTVAVTPALAVDALISELRRIGGMARGMALAAAGGPPVERADLRARHDAVTSLMRAVGEFITRLERSTMPVEVARELPRVLRTAQYFAAAAELAGAVVSAGRGLGQIGDPALALEWEGFRSRLEALLGVADFEASDFSAEGLDERLEVLEAVYQELKASLLEAGAGHRVPIKAMSELLDQASRMRRMAQQVAKGTRYLVGLAAGVAQAVAADGEEAGEDVAA